MVCCAGGSAQLLLTPGAALYLVSFVFLDLYWILILLQSKAGMAVFLIHRQVNKLNLKHEMGTTNIASIVRVGQPCA